MRKIVSHFVRISLGVILWLVNDSICDPVVQLESGQIVGRTIQFNGTEVNQFLGIRYAKPPIGELRFRKPEKLDLVPRYYEAVHVPPDCFQYTQSPHPLYLNGSYKSEDCLFLNIWTPSGANNADRKAVLFWIYGGGFKLGTAADPLYSGVALAAVGDIIVVVINYRLGAFGFLTTDTDGAPGNAGLYDILEALKWVNQNIYFFGGDTSRITIAGNSAGSIAVGYLSLSPLGDGLFSQMIMESESPDELGPDTKPLNLDLAERIAKKVGCLYDFNSLSDYRESVTECLKKIDAVDLERAEFELAKTYDFHPEYGNEFLPQNPREAVFNGEFRCRKLLTGNNRDEGSFYITSVKPELFGYFGEKYTSSNQTVTAEVAISILKTWFPKLLFEAKPYTLKELYTLVGDLLVLCPDEYYAEKCADIGGDVYSYFFVHRPSTTRFAPWMGVAHFEEMQFVFGNPLLNPAFYQPLEKQLSEDIIGFWSNFVKTGKPSENWPLYSKGNPVFRYLGISDPDKAYSTDGVYGIGPHKQACDRYRSIFAS